VRAWLRAPVLHYVLIGALLFVSRPWWRAVATGSPARSAAPKTIVVSSEQVGQIRSQWSARTGRLPDGDQLHAAVERAVDEEILYREALARGLDRDDEVVRQRLVSIMGFVSDSAAHASDADDALYHDALALGFDRNDVVVRAISSSRCNCSRVVPTPRSR